MLRKPLAVLALALAIPVFASGYANYCNSRYGFCVDYPANFGMEPAPVNNDGRVFYDGEGFRMTASGSPILGAVLGKGNVFTGAHNLHALSLLSSYSITVPDF